MPLYNPPSAAGGITNVAPTGAIPTTLDANGNLTGHSAFLYDPATKAMALIGASVFLTINGQGGDGNAFIRFQGLPVEDPGLSGRLWNDLGALKISEG